MPEPGEHINIPMASVAGEQEPAVALLDPLTGEVALAQANDPTLETNAFAEQSTPPTTEVDPGSNNTQEDGINPLVWSSAVSSMVIVAGGAVLISSIRPRRRR